MKPPNPLLMAAMGIAMYLLMVHVANSNHAPETLTPETTEVVESDVLQDQLSHNRQPVFEEEVVVQKNQQPTVADLLFGDGYFGPKANGLGFEVFCEIYDCQQTSENYVIYEKVLDIDALQNFILGYRARELERHNNMKQGRHLVTELEPVMNYVHSLVIDEFEFWNAVDAYTLEVMADIENTRDLAIGDSASEVLITGLLYQKKLKLMKGLQ